MIWWLLVLFMIVADAASGQSAKDAFRGLKKLEAKCQSGISYGDYTPALGDAKYEVNMFLESDEAKANPALSESIKKTMEHFEFAKKVWDWKIREKGSGLIVHHQPFRADNPPPSPNIERLIREQWKMKKDFAEEIFKLYPEANKPYGEGGTVKTFNDFYGIDLERLIHLVWGRASEELKNASKLFLKKESEK